MNERPLLKVPSSAWFKGIELRLCTVRLAFEAGRRAILRCQRSGYDLPEEKYPLWKRMEITFDPSEFVQ